MKLRTKNRNNFCIINFLNMRVTLHFKTFQHSNDQLVLQHKLFRIVIVSLICKAKTDITMIEFMATIQILFC